MVRSRAAATLIRPAFNAGHPADLTLRAKGSLSLRRKPPTEKKLDELRCLTLQQTAELLRVSVRTLEGMIQRKELPAIRVGHQWRIHKAELIKRIEGIKEL